MTIREQLDGGDLMGGVFALRRRSVLEIEILAVSAFGEIRAASFVCHRDLLEAFVMYFMMCIDVLCVLFLCITSFGWYSAQVGRNTIFVRVIDMIMFFFIILFGD